MTQYILVINNDERLANDEQDNPETVKEETTELLRSGYFDVEEVVVDSWEEIQKQLLWLQSLEDAGVDNWGGIDFAYETYQEELARLRG